MSYTFIKDDEWYARQYENRLNAVVRRCKIGKVEPKPTGVWPGILSAIAPYRQLKDTFFIQPQVMDHPRNCAPFISAFTAANA